VKTFTEEMLKDNSTEWLRGLSREIAAKTACFAGPEAVFAQDLGRFEGLTNGLSSLYTLS
jgi:hypothetical protein